MFSCSVPFAPVTLAFTKIFEPLDGGFGEKLTKNGTANLRELNMNSGNSEQYIDINMILNAIAPALHFRVGWCAENLVRNQQRTHFVLYFHLMLF